MLTRLFYAVLLISLLAACLPVPAPSPEITAAATPLVAAATPTRSPTAAPAASPTTPPVASPAPVLPSLTELIPHILPLDAPYDSPNAEFSGLAWAGETLLLLPQYPQRFGDSGSGALLALDRAELISAIGNPIFSLSPREIPLDLAGLPESIAGFEGFEALAVHSDRLYLTIEASPGGNMTGYLVSGWLAPDQSAARLDPASLIELPSPAGLPNKSDEALLIVGDTLYSFYEANGANVNPQPFARVFTLDLQPAGTLPLANLEYRLTDAALSPAATAAAEPVFWVINYFFPDESDLNPAPDVLADQYGLPSSHAADQVVERLVQFRLTPSGVELVDQPPVYLELLPDAARNWEGLAVLDGFGWLLITDKYPETLLAFVPFP